MPGSRRWRQLNGILAGTSQGYVEVRKTLGDNPFIARRKNAYSRLSTKAPSPVRSPGLPPSLITP